MTRFQVIIRGYNCKKYISACLKSLIAQSYTNWLATVILDAPTDGCESIACKYADRDDRISVYVNHKRVGISANIWRGMKYAYADSEDVIAWLDADDELFDYALKIVAKAYEKKPDLLATHGSYWRMDLKRRTKMSRAYRKSVRTESWRGSHLKTFKYKLMAHFPKKYLKDKKGNWYKASSDVALMIPILELAGLDRVKFIHKCIYKWRMTPNAIYKDKTGGKLQLKNKREILKKVPLERVEI
jgi:glycosyltransferase involved in cell wall biosynthesis